VSEKPPIRRSDLPASDRKKIDELEKQVQRNAVAIVIWENHFSPAERKELGNDIYLAWKQKGRTAGMWAAVREVSRERAIIDIAYALDWLDTKTRTQLLKAIGDDATAGGKPRWIARTCELWFEGEIVRRVRNPAKAAHVVRILAEFEQSNWPHRVDDPVTSGGDSSRRRRAIESLNKGLTRIRFACAGDGTSYSWEVIPTTARKRSAKKSNRKKQPRTR
jgi:hypothetical protein